MLNESSSPENPCLYEFFELKIFPSALLCTSTSFQIDAFVSTGHAQCGLPSVKTWLFWRNRRGVPLPYGAEYPYAELIMTENTLGGVQLRSAAKNKNILDTER